MDIWKGKYIYRADGLLSEFKVGSLTYTLDNQQWKLKDIYCLIYILHMLSHCEP